VTDSQWFAYLFNWRSGIARFTLDNERAREIDVSDIVPPKGWVP
jgi:hypothetical protein